MTFQIVSLRAPRVGAIGIAVFLLLLAALQLPGRARAACVPLPSPELRSLDDESLQNPEAAAKHAQDLLHSNPSAATAAELFSVIAEARASENRGDDATAEIDSGRALLPAIRDRALAARLGVRFTVTVANAAQGPADYRASVAELTRQLEGLPLNSVERACVLVTRGYLYGELDQLDLATADELDAYNRSRGASWDEVRSSAAFELASIYQRTGLLDDARAMIDESIAWAKAGNRASTLAITESTLGQVLVEQRLFDAALREFNASRQASLRMNDRSGAAYADLSRCDALIKAERLQQARSVCSQSASEFTQARMPDLVILVHSYEAQIDLENRNFAVALAKYDAVLADPAQRLLPRHRAKISRGRARALEALGRHREALRELQTFVQLTTDANLAERARTAGVLNARFKAEHIVEANTALRRQVDIEQRQFQTQRTATRWALGFAVLATLVSLLLAAILMLVSRHRRDTRRQDLVLRTLAANAPDTLLLLGADGAIKFANRPLFDQSSVPRSGEAMLDWIPESVRPQFESTLQRVSLARAPEQFDIRLQRVGEAERHFEQHALPIVENGRVVATTLRSTEVTERRRMEEKLVTQSRVLETMSEGVILVSDQQRIEFANRAFLSMIGDAQADLAALDPRALGLDLSLEAPADARRQSVLQTRDGGQRLVSIAISRFAPYDRNWLICVIQDITETQRLELEVLNVAVRERDRFSSDVHEGLGQELVGIALLLQSLRRLKPADAGSLDERLVEIIEHVNRTIQIARDLAHGLSPIQIERGSLGAALTRLATDLSGRLRISIRCAVDIPGVDVGLPVADYLYRCAREAISNAMRHGAATDIEICLVTRSDHLVLSITDNGSGIRATSAGSGLGLRMIAHRARLIGGTLQIKPSSIGGTSISILVPLPRLTEPQEIQRF